MDCPEEKLVVELDGSEHFTPEGEDNDTERDEYLNNLGIKVLRYENRDVFNHVEAVLEDIKANFRV